jgi:hypothetical protein
VRLAVERGEQRDGLLELLAGLLEVAAPSFDGAHVLGVEREPARRIADVLEQRASLPDHPLGALDVAELVADHIHGRDHRSRRELVVTAGLRVDDRLIEHGLGLFGLARARVDGAERGPDLGAQGLVTERARGLEQRRCASFHLCVSAGSDRRVDGIELDAEPLDVGAHARILGQRRGRLEQLEVVAGVDGRERVDGFERVEQVGLARGLEAREQGVELTAPTIEAAHAQVERASRLLAVHVGGLARTLVG